MANRRLDLTGLTFGAFKVLEWDKESFGQKSSRWVCECLKCGHRFSTNAQNVKKNAGCCAKCRGTNRIYSKIEVRCANPACTNLTVTESRHPHKFCSPDCARDHKNLTKKEVRGQIRKMLINLVVQCRSRAKRKEMPFDLTEEFVLDLYDRQDGKCARTGRDLMASRPVAKSRSGADTVSLDRVDSGKGYTKDNVELVVYHYNVAKAAFSQEEFISLCKDVLTKAGYAVPEKEKAVHHE